LLLKALIQNIEINAGTSRSIDWDFLKSRQLKTDCVNPSRSLITTGRMVSRFVRLVRFD
jgi:hypothetical protein